MMETLDFELALLPELVDEETERMIGQSYHWGRHSEDSANQWLGFERICVA